MRSENGDDRALVGLVDEVLHFLAGQGLEEGQDGVVLLMAFLDAKDVGVGLGAGAGGILYRERSRR